MGMVAPQARVFFDDLVGAAVFGDGLDAAGDCGHSGERQAALQPERALLVSGESVLVNLVFSSTAAPSKIALP